MAKPKAKPKAKAKADPKGTPVSLPPPSPEAEAYMYREDRHNLLLKILECDRVLFHIEGPKELQGHIDGLREQIALRAYNILRSSTSNLAPPA